MIITKPKNTQNASFQINIRISRRTFTDAKLNQQINDRSTPKSVYIKVVYQFLVLERLLTAVKLLTTFQFFPLVITENMSQKSTTQQHKKIFLNIKNINKF